MQINVKVERVLYPKATEKEATWFILATNQGVCKGKIGWRPADGQQLVLDGEWASYRGERQLNFKCAMLDVPTDPRAQLHYVCERTRGVGPALEIQIWDAAGEQWQGLRPGGVVAKLKGKLFEEFRLQIESLKGDEEQVKTVSWLMSKGATNGMGIAAWNKWEKGTIGIVNSDPFHLAELSGYGFKNVDGGIRQAFEIGDDDPRRIRAAVIYSLRRLTDDGSTIVYWDELLKKGLGMLGGFQSLISESTSALFADGTLIGFKGSLSIALGSDYKAEMSILDYVEGREMNTKQEIAK